MIQLIKFLLVGVFNTALGYAVIFSCMYLLALSAVLSNVIGYSAGLIFSYTLNRTVTFKNISKSKTDIFRFLLVFLVAYFVNLFVLLFLIRVTGFNEGVAQVLAGLVYVMVSFLLNKYYVFRQRI